MVPVRYMVWVQGDEAGGIKARILEQSAEWELADTVVLKARLRAKYVPELTDAEVPRLKVLVDSYA